MSLAQPPPNGHTHATGSIDPDHSGPPSASTPPKHPVDLQIITEKVTEIIRYTLGSDPNIDSTSEPDASIDHGLLRRVLRQLRAGDMKLPDDVGVVVSAIQLYIDGGLIDNKNALVRRHHYCRANASTVSLTDQLVERIVELAAALPEESKGGNVIAGEMVKHLWETLDHPPLTSLGDQYKYRAADGSNNMSASTPHHQKRQSDLM